MTRVIWVRPIGPAPRSGTKLRVDLQQDGADYDIASALGLSTRAVGCA
jgi:hypothetical protein